MEALKGASTMLAELRTSSLTPVRPDLPESSLIAVSARVTVLFGFVETIL